MFGAKTPSYGAEIKFGNSFTNFLLDSRRTLASSISQKNLQQRIFWRREKKEVEVNFYVFTTPPPVNISVDHTRKKKYRKLISLTAFRRMWEEMRFLHHLCWRWECFCSESFVKNIFVPKWQHWKCFFYTLPLNLILRISHTCKLCTFLLKLFEVCYLKITLNRNTY